MREVHIEQHLTGRVERLGGWAPKWVSPGNAGVPDRLVILPTAPCPCCGSPCRVGSIEIKNQGERPRSLQLRQMERLAALGLPVGWASSHTGVDAFVAALAAPGDARGPFDRGLLHFQ